VSFGGKPVYVANSYPAVTPARQMPAAIKLIQAPTQSVAGAAAISIASYAYQPVQTPVIYSNASLISIGSPASTATVTGALAGRNFTVYASGEYYYIT
jgi:hypothetical protein